MRESKKDELNDDRSNNSGSLERRRKKKKKKDDRNKDKKHKSKSKDLSPHLGGKKNDVSRTDDINLWLETAESEPTTLQNHQQKSSSKKKDKKKHKKSSKDRDEESHQTKEPKKQRLIDNKGVRLDCYLESVLNDAENKNVKLTFVCENKEKEFILDDVELSVEGGQQITVMSNSIKTKVTPQNSVKEHILLKVSN